MPLEYLKRDSKRTYRVVGIDLGNPPCGIGPLLPYPLASPLPPGVVQLPPIDISLRSRGLIRESIEPVHSPHLACPLLEVLVDIARLRLAGEVEADEGKVTAPQSNRRWLPGYSWRRTEGAEGDYRVGDP